MHVNNFTKAAYLLDLLKVYPDVLAFSKASHPLGLRLDATSLRKIMRRLGLAGECQAHNEWISPALGANQLRLLMPHLNIVGYITNLTGFYALRSLLLLCGCKLSLFRHGLGQKGDKVTVLPFLCNQIK